jgi:choline trimethylamine-lyase
MTMGGAMSITELDVAQEQVQVTVSGQLSPRLQRIKADFQATKPSISVDRARAYTEVYKENPGLPQVLLRAKGFARACDTARVSVFPEELIVGHPAGRKRAGIMTPENAWRWIAAELDTFSTRPQDPYEIDDADKAVVRDEIVPFWRGRSVDEIVCAEIEQLGLAAISLETGVIDAENKSCYGAGEVAPGFEAIVLKKGLQGIKDDAFEQLSTYDRARPDHIDKIYFLQAVITCCDAVMRLAARYAAHAAALASVESSAERKAELEAIAETCARVPANPPRSFQEALQSVWFVIAAAMLEENQQSIGSPGRVDQYLLSYLRQDVLDGRLSAEEARELMCCFLMKFAETPWLLSEAGAKYYAGYTTFSNVCVGGQKREGGDATNELTYLVIDCIKALRMHQPSLSVRIHNGSPTEYLRRIVDLIKAGLGFPACHFDDASIKMLLAKGVTVEDARDFTVMGCVEPSLAGKMSQWTTACYVSVPMAIEFAMTNGRHRLSGQQLGLETGDPVGFSAFAEFEAAVEQQLRHLAGACGTISVVSQRAHKAYMPKPFVSCLMEGCVESGQDLMDGGAVYNWGPGLVWVGLADYADSMAAVKSLVYEQGLTSMEELEAALDSDFVGYENLRHACLQVPKYGNDDDFADGFARDAVGFVGKTMGELRGLYAPMGAAGITASANTPQGLNVGALPSGRRAGTPLADGVSPSQGADRRGPTSAIKSADKINQEAWNIGLLQNMKFEPSAFGGEDGDLNLVALLRTHSQLGGAHIQFNYVSRSELLDAQLHPEEHASLMVRVAGYSAYFVDLCKEIQDDIINRTAQTSWS